MRRPQDLTGLKFGRWTVHRMVNVTSARGVRWECSCDCGNTKVISAACLKGGNSKSCGCFRRELMREAAKTRNLRHGEGSNGKETPEYRAWTAMLSRCNNSNHRMYPDYGGRGIKVCARWSLYENFLADMGRRPSDKHSLDRSNNEGGYSPENCRWATAIQQNNNQRRKTHETKYGKHALFEHSGKTQPISEWCHETGIKMRTYRARRQAGMTMAEALFTPLMPLGRKTRTQS